MAGSRHAVRLYWHAPYGLRDPERVDDDVINDQTMARQICERVWLCACMLMTAAAALTRPTTALMAKDDAYDNVENAYAYDYALW